MHSVAQRTSSAASRARALASNAAPSARVIDSDSFFLAAAWNEIGHGEDTELPHEASRRQLWWLDQVLPFAQYSMQAH
jgi:hypothetical protein